MDTKCPRDDSMYRTTEFYMLNVPEKQLATEMPRYLADSPKLYPQSLKEKFNKSFVSNQTS